jgi:hypothetical protein
MRLRHLFSWKLGKEDKERENHCSCIGFYWFALEATLAIPTLEVVGITMVEKKDESITG